MESMGKGELWFLLIMSVSSIPLLSLAQTGKGTTGLIRSAIGSITAAREDYDAQKGSHAWSLDVEGRNNRTYDDIAGSYPVIGPYGESGFIVGTPDGPRSLCRNSTCDWYSEHSALVKGDPQQTTTTTVQVERIAADSLHASLASLQASGAVYLLGELLATGVVPSPPTIEVNSESVHLRYASPEVLRRWEKKQLKDVNLTIQIRHNPVVRVDEIVNIAPATEEKIDPLLQKWLDVSGK
jgi:inner membrane protein